MAILDGRDDFFIESRYRYCGYNLSPEVRIAR